MTGAEQPAGFFSRLEAFIVDLVVISVLGLMTALLAGLIIYLFRLNKLLHLVQNLVPATDEFQGIALLISPLVYLLVVSYFVFFWTLVGYTPGKALLGLRIVRRDSRPLSFGRAVLRFVGYLISAVPLFLGFIWIIFDRRREGWHDKISDTHVVYAWKKPPG